MFTLVVQCKSQFEQSFATRNDNKHHNLYVRKKKITFKRMELMNKKRLARIKHWWKQIFEALQIKWSFKSHGFHTTNVQKWCLSMRVRFNTEQNKNMHKHIIKRDTHIQIQWFPLLFYPFVHIHIHSCMFDAVHFVSLIPSHIAIQCNLFGHALHTVVAVILYFLTAKQRRANETDVDTKCVFGYCHCVPLYALLLHAYMYKSFVFSCDANGCVLQHSNWQHCDEPKRLARHYESSRRTGLKMVVCMCWFVKLSC